MITTVRDTSFYIRSADKSILEISRSSIARYRRRRKEIDVSLTNSCNEEKEPPTARNYYRNSFGGRPLHSHRTRTVASIKDFGWSGIKATLASNIHLGLDLKGGSHLVMSVKTEEFLKHLAEGNAVAAENAAKDAGFEVKSARADVGNGKL